MDQQAASVPPGVEIREIRPLFQGYFRVDRFTLRHKLFAGGMSDEITREVFQRGHAAAVLPYDPLRDEVVLIEQFRAGALAAGWHPWLIEPVAGIIDEGETLTGTVEREAQEEAGTAILDLIPMYHYLTSPGAVSETCALFCGRVNSEGAGGVHGVPGEHEDIRVITVPFSEILAWLDAAKPNNAVLIIALQWLALNRDKIRAKWR